MTLGPSNLQFNQPRIGVGGPGGVSNILARGFTGATAGATGLVGGRNAADSLRQSNLQRGPTVRGALQQQLADIVQGLPGQFDPENFLSGFLSRQLPALAGARAQIGGNLARRGLTGSGAEIGAFSNLESQAATQRTGAFSDFLLQRPNLQLEALGSATDIFRRLGGGGLGSIRGGGGGRGPSGPPSRPLGPVGLQDPQVRGAGQVGTTVGGGGRGGLGQLRGLRDIGRAGGLGSSPLQRL